ncbi:MAG: GTPase ObgE [Cyanobacteria bacterium P01_H01_bin.74]
MFIDKASIAIQSGAGGNGMVAWRREKYEPNGGPAGGDGGKGGDVYLVAGNDLNTLLEFRNQAVFKAEDGVKGGPKNCHGRAGKDRYITVPCGTIVYDEASGDAIADLTHDGQSVLVAAGGRGGRGNSRFASSRRKSPAFCEPGEAGIERRLLLELKLLADVGIIGLPNAGKSTLISKVSAAKPKIADYPFTTLVPNLGVVKKSDGNGLILADIPGLIEGASDGIGLGHEFLRHVERCRLLLHLVDIATDSIGTSDDLKPPIDHYHLINRELAQYSPRLAEKPQVLVLSKIDAVPEETIKQAIHAFQALQTDPEMPVFAISAVSGHGTDALLNAVIAQLESLPEEKAVVTVVTDTKALDNDDSRFEVYQEGREFSVVGGKIHRLFEVTDITNREALERVMNILKAMGVFKALKARGAQEGDVIWMAGHEFDYTDEHI